MTQENGNGKIEMGLVPVNFSEAKEMSRVLAASTLLPEALQQKPADVLVTIMAGQELGVSPMAALRGIHVIKGKPTLSADMMVALVRRSGQCKFFEEVESDDSKATYETQRVGDPRPVRATFTIADAQRAKLVKGGGNWEMYPSAMLRARAKSILCRKVYEDVCFGLYATEELAETVDMVEISPGHYSPPPSGGNGSNGTPPPIGATPGFEEPSSPTTAETASTSDDDDPLTREIAAIEVSIGKCETAEELGSLATRCSDLPKGPDRDRLRQLWGERREALRTAGATL